MKLKIGLLASVMLVVGLSTTVNAGASVESPSGTDELPVPCDQFINGFLYCGDSNVTPVEAGENGTHDGVPLPSNKVVTVQDGQGFTFQTGEYEVKTINQAEAAEQLPDGTLTDAYYERLNRQYCEVKPWAC